MSDFILANGDIVQFMPNFGAAIVVALPGTLQGSGPATLNSQTVCVEGDEKNVKVPGCMYNTPAYPIPGVGTLSIQALAGDQMAKKTKTGGKAVLLKGGQFDAQFEVQSPAQQPTPSGSPVPDATPKYSGKGLFISSNIKFQGS